MEAEKDGDEIRKAAARRYGDWVSEQLQRRNWTQADLARLSGLKKQTVGQIVRGASTQPTAWQVAAISRVFRVEPNEVFELTGLWEPGAVRVGAAREVVDIFHKLAFPERRFLLNTARGLKELQAEYTAMVRGSVEDSLQSEDADLGDIGLNRPAAYDRDLKPPVDEDE